VTLLACLPFRAAALTLRTVLLSLQALLSAAEPDDPQDAVVARQYKENRKVFMKTAKFWAQHYAQGKYWAFSSCWKKLFCSLHLHSTVWLVSFLTLSAKSSCKMSHGPVVRGWSCKLTPKSFDLLKIWAKSKKIRAHKFRHFYQF